MSFRMSWKNHRCSCLTIGMDYLLLDLAHHIPLKRRRYLPRASQLRTIIFVQVLATVFMEQHDGQDRAHRAVVVVVLPRPPRCPRCPRRPSRHQRRHHHHRLHAQANMFMVIRQSHAQALLNTLKDQELEKIRDDSGHRRLEMIVILLLVVMHL